MAGIYELPFIEKSPIFEQGWPETWPGGFAENPFSVQESLPAIPKVDIWRLLSNPVYNPTISQMIAGPFGNRRLPSQPAYQYSSPWQDEMILMPTPEKTITTNLWDKLRAFEPLWRIRDLQNRFNLSPQLSTFEDFEDFREKALRQAFLRLWLSSSNMEEDE